MASYVIDASVGFKWLFPEEFEEQAELLISSSDTLWVPDLFFSEITNTLWKKVRLENISLAKAKSSLLALKSFDLQSVISLDLQMAALEIATIVNQSTYDSLYIALAVQKETQMITADKRFYNSLQNTPFADYVSWIGHDTIHV